MNITNIYCTCGKSMFCDTDYAGCYHKSESAIATANTEPSPTRLKEGREEDNPTVQEVLKIAYAQTMQIDMADTELNEAKAVKAYQVINEIQDILGIYLQGDYNLWIESFRQSPSTPQPEITEGEIEPGDSFRFVSGDGKVTAETKRVIGNSMYDSRYWILGENGNLYDKTKCTKLQSRLPDSGSEELDYAFGSPDSLGQQDPQWIPIPPSQPEGEERLKQERPFIDDSNRVFYIDIFRKYLKMYDAEQISMSRFVELLNEDAYKFYNTADGQDLYTFWQMKHFFEDGHNLGKSGELYNSNEIIKKYHPAIKANHEKALEEMYKAGHHNGKSIGKRHEQRANHPDQSKVVIKISSKELDDLYIASESDCPRKDFDKIFMESIEYAEKYLKESALASMNPDAGGDERDKSFNTFVKAAQNMKPRALNHLQEMGWMLIPESAKELWKTLNIMNDYCMNIIEFYGGSAEQYRTESILKKYSQYI